MVDLQGIKGMIGMNEALDGKTTLTVRGGKMTVHIPMKSQHLTKAYAGTPAKAAKKGAKYCKRTTETIDDGEVYSFDVPVKKLNRSFTVSFYSKKNKRWYGQKVTVKYDR